jgi:hypothetical protein
MHPEDHSCDCNCQYLKPVVNEIDTPVFLIPHILSQLNHPPTANVTKPFSALNIFRRNKLDRLTLANILILVASS